MMEKTLEEQMVLRLPPQLADQVRKMLRTKQLTEEIEFEFDEDQRNAKFRVGRKKYDAYVVDLPCTVESHKTLDKTTYYKSADIGQMLIVQDPKDPQPPPNDFKSLNGITPATRNIRHRKWRKPPDAVQLKEIENEVNRLLKPADNESIEILNADDYEDLDEMNGAVVEKVEAPSVLLQNKIIFRRNEERAPEAIPETKEKKKKGERRRKEKKVPEGEGVGVGASVAAGGAVKVKKERRRRKKKDGEDGEAAPQPDVATAEKKKPKRRERKTKPKGAASEPALPNSPPATPTSAPAFPFSTSTTVSPLPPAMPIPSSFVQTPITTKIATPAFNSNPFANAGSSAFTSPITARPLLSNSSQSLSQSQSLPQQPLVSITTPSSASGQENMGLQQLQKKLQQEVDQLKLKVTDATNKYNILPNAILKQRQQGRLQEVTEQHAQKVKELEMVDKQLKEAQRG